jgi:hypothetical protein
MKTERESLNIKGLQDASTWQEKGKVLSNLHKGHQWEIADWLIEGIALYPDGTSHGNASKAYDVAEKLFSGYTRSTFQTWVSVARTFGSLTRDKYPSLFFNHFKAVLAVRSPYPPEPYPPANNAAALSAYQARQAAREKETVARRERWLAQAEERHLSISALSFAINNAYEIENDKLAPPTQADTEPEAPPAPAPPKQTEPAKPKTEKGYSLPLSHTQQKALETLALGRGISPAILAAQAVAEYLETCADEIGGAAEQQAKQRAEIEAAEDACMAISADERAASIAAQEADRKKEQAAREAILQQVEPVRRYATDSGNTDLLKEVAEFDAWMKDQLFDARFWLANPSKRGKDRVENLLKRVEALKKTELTKAEAQHVPGGTNSRMERRTNE